MKELEVQEKELQKDMSVGSDEPREISKLLSYHDSIFENLNALEEKENESSSNNEAGEEEQEEQNESESEQSEETETEMREHGDLPRVILSGGSNKSEVRQVSVQELSESSKAMGQNSRQSNN